MGDPSSLPVVADVVAVRVVSRQNRVHSGRGAPLNLSDRLEALYGANPLEHMRARGMVVVYATGIVISVVMAGHDLYTHVHYLELHLLNEVILAALQLFGIVAVLRGRSDWGGAVVVPLVVVFSAASLTDVANGTPAGFYDGFARWYPAFIVASVLFSSQWVAMTLTGWAITWNVLFYWLFCRELPDGERMEALAEVWEVSAVDGLIGALAVAGMIMVRSSNARVDAELERNRKLNAELERRVEERTRALESRLAERQAILRNLGDGLLVLAADGVTVELVNRALAKLYDLDTDVTGAQATTLFPADLLAVFEEAHAAGDSGAFQADVSLPGGRTGVAVATCFGSGGGKGVVAVVRDVTDQREVDRMKTEFISMASHELRTPLTSVFGFARIIQGRFSKTLRPALPDEPKVQRAARTVEENIGIIVSEGERLTTLINDILDISKMEAGRMDYRMESLQVDSLCRSASAAVSSLFEEDQVQLALEVQDCPSIRGDEHRLIQVLVNLLSNARKFTPVGQVKLQAKPVEGGVEFAVQDTGVGIAASDLDAVFERFRQVGDVLTGKPKGTGLGLAICQQIAAAHDTRLQLESKVGVGSRFSFVIGLDPAAS